MNRVGAGTERWSWQNRKNPLAVAGKLAPELPLHVGRIEMDPRHITQEREPKTEQKMLDPFELALVDSKHVAITAGWVYIV
jgi:hypothetical protein